MHLVYMWEVEKKVPRPDCLCMLFQERSASFPICLTCVHIAMTINYKEKQFSTAWEKGSGWKAEPSLGLPLHLTSGFDCAGSLTHSVCLYDLSCLSHRLYSSLFFPLSPSLGSSFSSPLFTNPAIAGCQSINKQLASDSFSIAAALPLPLWHWHWHRPPPLRPPSPPAVYSMCISIYPNVITRFNMSAGGRGRVHYSAVFFIGVQRRL